MTKFIQGTTTTFDQAKMKDWPNASIEAVRDCILGSRVTAICLQQSDRKDQEEILETLMESAIDAVVAGRMIDAGHLPNAVIKSEASSMDGSGTPSDLPTSCSTHGRGAPRPCW